jgi:two-component system chemotaxis sensor kinase CheA
MPGEETTFDDLFGDFAAECDEHLVAAGKVLLKLESNPDQITRAQLDELFRNFHTIKGLASMVGVEEIERLAHHLENYLGVVRNNEVPLTVPGVELLIDCTSRFEQLIAAKRNRQPLPSNDDLLSRFGSLLPSLPPGSARKAESPAEQPSSSPTKLDQDTQDKIDSALQRGLRMWRITFSPSPTLAEQGISVGTVRQRLVSAGEIISAVPTVVPGAGVTFTFLVGAQTAVTTDTLSGPGTTIEPYAVLASVEKPVILPHSPAPSITSSNLVRVDLARLDDLMRTVGELVITRSLLETGLMQIAPQLQPSARRSLEETSSSLDRQLRELRDGVMRVRLVPVREVFARMRYVVRDLMRETKKEVDLHLSGEGTEFDKYLIDRLTDPLLHLVRNAISHGLESAADRRLAGKPPRGRVDLRAATSGGKVIIEVEDDGRGINAEPVFTRAREGGLIADDNSRDGFTLLDVLCLPGFSTRDRADLASGRGVGLDVVRRAIEDLNGTLTLVTTPGQGTRFIVELPITLAIADALLIGAGEATYAVPQTSVREVVLVEPGAITSLENNELLRHYQNVLPLVRIGNVFAGIHNSNDQLRLGSGTRQSSEEAVARLPSGSRKSGDFRHQDGDRLTALIVGEGKSAVALGADRVIGLREIVVRPLADPLLQVPGIGGATELGDGKPVLILDTVSLIRFARTRRRASA